MTIDDPLLTPKEAAHYLRCTTTTLERMRLAGNGPRYHRRTPGKRSGILYRRSDLDKHLDDNTHNSTSEYRKPQDRSPRNPGDPDQWPAPHGSNPKPRR